eukprot:c16218_g1_i1.p1 GENE.c16218_g1_i1~~c16218_g1_i1.p1  ORF type:complete len:421 (-),score=40.86 c16218_g1_i1:65-1327(-)
MGCLGWVLVVVFAGLAQAENVRSLQPPTQTTIQGFQARPGAATPQLNLEALKIALARQRAGIKGESVGTQQYAPRPQFPNQPVGFQQANTQPPPQGIPTQFPNQGQAFPTYPDSRPNVQQTRPNAPGVPAAPARPFIDKLGEMLSGILGGGLKAVGGGLRTVTGAGSVSVFSGVLGMMGYSGPYGYDPFGPGQSQDPFSQSMPETNSCYQLLETWLRQCSAQPEAFLEITTITAAPTDSAPETADPKAPKENALVVKIAKDGAITTQMNSDSSPQAAVAVDHSSFLELGEFAPEVSRKPLSDTERQHAMSLLAQIMSTQASALTQSQSNPGFGSRPAPPANPGAPAAPAGPAAPGMFDQIATGTGMTPAMGGLVSQTLGPDTYNPWVADGAEPDEFQISGPEKCTRMMNNWLWKCAMSPL